MIPSIGPLEIIIVLAIVLLLFGAKRLPELGSGLGRGLRDFGKGLKGEDETPAIAERSEDKAATR